MDELKKEIPGIDWDAFLNGIGVKGVTELSVSQVDPIKEVEKIINSLPVENQIAYMQWSLIDRAAGYLSDDLVAQKFLIFMEKHYPENRLTNLVGSVL